MRRRWTGPCPFGARSARPTLVSSGWPRASSSKCRARWAKGASSWRRARTTFAPSLTFWRYSRNTVCRSRRTKTQKLSGMGDQLRAALSQRGMRIREYAPVGEMIPGMAYFVRRLLENTSNQSWLRAGFSDEVADDVLLASPHGPGVRVRGIKPRKLQISKSPNLQIRPALTLTLSQRERGPGVRRPRGMR